METDLGEAIELPWDMLWLDDGRAVECLQGSFRLAAIWNPPTALVDRGLRPPDIYSCFLLHQAVTAAVRDVLAPIVGIEAEFLPVRVPDADAVYVIHPLLPVDFDDAAIVHRQGTIGNITRVEKYSFTFNYGAFNGTRHLFRMLQAKRSSARDAGATLNELVVSETVQQACTNAGARGVVFRKVHTVPPPPRGANQSE